jgi:hypothetical protein
VEEHWETEDGEGASLYVVENLVLDAPLSRESFAYALPEEATPDPESEVTKWVLPLTGLPGKARDVGLPL